MTKAEAIETLKRAVEILKSEAMYESEFAEALNIAIKSLKALEKIDDLVHKTYWAYPIGIDYCLDSLEDILKEVEE